MLDGVGEGGDEVAIYHSTKLAASLLQLVKRLRWQRGSTVTDEQHKAQVEGGMGSAGTVLLG